ncbi:hypothetical protein [Stakelama tenebrarum]|uniref:Uncharacterized protein n=1 Tax=Stakelama tenebrarum TaxID=2711215 RepID=A0A6G6Y615_9SPHN|nr:hypothetical protein [Sphingosinithalassobacter tenebrarum]QIG80394.1 hypothetical protein G5C33_11810 [Sphingosinithalassobacter tenebrarum]
MTEFLVFIYALASGFVLMTLRRNQRLERPSPQMMTMAGWGLFSLSSTLAVLLAGLAVAAMLGMPLPIADGVPLQ